jgi:hypothetical protein
MQHHHDRQLARWQNDVQNDRVNPHEEGWGLDHDTMQREVAWAYNGAMHARWQFGVVAMVNKRNSGKVKAIGIRARQSKKGKNGKGGSCKSREEWRK